MGQWTPLRVNQSRLWHRLMQVATIGATPAGGVNRQAMTQGDAQAHELLIRWGEEIGLQPCVDPIGNLFLRPRDTDPDAMPILTGSHLDTQPTGGKFDGAYGVMAALEVLTRLNEEGVETLAPIELVVWNNEEGCRFEPTTMGSSVFSGALSLKDALKETDADGTSVAHALQTLVDFERPVSKRSLGFPLAGYLEAHIEQGPSLEEEGCPVGIVSGIQGLRWYTVEIYGQAGHAGTTPQARRRDALMSAVSILQALQRHFHDSDDIVRFTVGRMHVTPNSPNTIPERVRFTIDFRHPQTEILKRLGDAVPAVCSEAAGVCEVQVTESPASPPIRFHADVVEMLDETASALGLRHRTLHSGATHDAKWINEIAPSGMIFVPCRAGISHNEKESAAPDNLAAGATLLINTLVRMANDRQFLRS